MGKYSKIVEELGLKKVPRTEKVQMVKSYILSHSEESGLENGQVETALKTLISNRLDPNRSAFDPTNIATVYCHWKKLREQVNDKLNVIGIVLEALAEILEESFEREQVSKLTIGDQTISTSPLPSASVEDEEQFRQWAINKGYLELFRLPSATLSKIVKEMLVQGEYIPEFLNVHYKERISVRKSS